MNKLFIILAIIAVLIVGCTSTNSKEQTICIRGDITSIYIDNENSIIKVDGKKEKDTQYLKATVNITKDTVIQNKTNDKLYNINDLELGMTVEVIFNECTMEDNTVKGNANIIKVINE